jgi:putative aldouronate transport system substrate-binding protein
VKSVIFSLDSGFVPPAAKDQKFMDYKTTWDEKVTKILIGELPVDAFDDVQKKWFDNGGKQFVEQLNEYIKKSSK